MQKAYKAYRAINFDLNTQKLREHYSETNPKGAYKDIMKYLDELGFSHRQYSGYCSKKALSDKDLLIVIDRLFQKFPWLDECSTVFDVTNIYKVYDIKELRRKSVIHKEPHSNKDRLIEESIIQSGREQSFQQDASMYRSKRRRQR